MLRSQSQRKSRFLHQQKVAWDKLIAEVADLRSRVAEAFQRAKGAEKELVAWRQDGAEATQIKRECDLLCQVESQLRAERDAVQQNYANVQRQLGDLMGVVEREKE